MAESSAQFISIMCGCNLSLCRDCGNLFPHPHICTLSVQCASKFTRTQVWLTHWELLSGSSYVWQCERDTDRSWHTSCHSLCPEILLQTWLCHYPAARKRQESRINLSFDIYVRSDYMCLLLPVIYSIEPLGRATRKEFLQHLVWGIAYIDRRSWTMFPKIRRKLSCMFRLTARIVQTGEGNCWQKCKSLLYQRGLNKPIYSLEVNAQLPCLL